MLIVLAGNKTLSRKKKGGISIDSALFTEHGYE
jgi:hypothetical protein